jgi:hypothetical protein
VIDFEVKRDWGYGDGSCAATLTVSDGVPPWMREKRLGRFNAAGERVFRDGNLANSGRLPREVTVSASDDWSVEGGQAWLFLGRHEVATLRDWLTAWLNEDDTAETNGSSL